MSKKYIRTKTRSSKKSCYHTDPECNRLVGEKREVSETEIEYHNLTECKVCQETDYRTNQTRDYSYQNALKEAADD